MTVILAHCCDDLFHIHVRHEDTFNPNLRIMLPVQRMAAANTPRKTHAMQHYGVLRSLWWRHCRSRRNPAYMP
jgi:hypothetical protein